MKKAISKRLKEQVARRAGFCCEYCLLDEFNSFYTFHVDHIKSQKHGGLTKAENLAYCCPDCNFHKGTDIATSIQDGEFTRFSTHVLINGMTTLSFPKAQFLAKL